MRLAIALLISVLALPQFALAEARIALVIGNGDYGAAGKLKNAPNDARLMAASLSDVGFDVTLVREADQATMKRAVAEFGRTLRQAGRDTVALFYFAGHGVQHAGRNFLAPIGSDVRDESELELFAIDVGWVMRQMASNEGGMNIVILDACRNNPFSRSFRSARSGLAQMRAPHGSFIAYSTAPGDLAADGTGPHSPYTSALARAIRMPGLPIEQIFKKVRLDVLSATDGVQMPWDSSSLTRDFVFEPALPVETKTVGVEADTHLWKAIDGTGNEEYLELFLSLYADSPHARTADRQLRIARGEPVAPERVQRVIGPDDNSDSLQLSFSIDYAGSTWSMCAPEQFRDPVNLSFAGGVAASTAVSTLGRSFALSAERSGNEVDLEVVPLAGTPAEGDPFSITLDLTERGHEQRFYTRAKTGDDLRQCGAIVAYFTVL